MQTCQTCRFYSAIAGQCRAHAPQAFMIGIDQRSGQPLFYGAWPGVSPEGFCGEHKPEDVLGALSS